MSYNYIELFSLFRFCFAHTLTNHCKRLVPPPQPLPQPPFTRPRPRPPSNSRNNSVSQADYNKLPKNPQAPTVNNGGGPVPMNGSATPSSNGSGPFKPVPPPKPKNYRPPVQSGGSSGSGGTTPWENGVSEWEWIALAGFPLKLCLLCTTGFRFATFAQWLLLPANTFAPSLRTTDAGTRLSASRSCRNLWRQQWQLWPSAATTAATTTAALWLHQWLQWQQSPL